MCKMKFQGSKVKRIRPYHAGIMRHEQPAIYAAFAAFQANIPLNAYGITRDLV